MDEEQRAKLLAEWLNGPAGAPPPEGLDDETLAAVFALSPGRAPSPRVTADDVLAQVTEGPFATPAQTTPEVVRFPVAANSPPPARRRRSSAAWWAVPGLGVAMAAAAAVVLVLVVPIVGTEATDPLDRGAPASAPPPPPPPPGVPEMASAPGAASVDGAPSADAPPAPSALDAPSPLDAPSALDAAAPVAGPTGFAGGSGTVASAPVEAQAPAAEPVAQLGAAREMAAVEKEERREQPMTAANQAPAAVAGGELAEEAKGDVVADLSDRDVRSKKDEAAVEGARARAEAQGASSGYADDASDEVQTLAKAPQKSARAPAPSSTAGRTATGASAPAGGAAPAPAATPPADGMARRAEATAFDYDTGWYTRYPDVVPTYQTAAALEAAGDWAGAAALYRTLVGDARVDLAQDAAWRAGRALWAQGRADEALTVVRGGLTRSSAGTVFRVHLLVLAGDILNAQGRSNDAVRAWSEAAEANRHR